MLIEIIIAIALLVLSVMDIMFKRIPFLIIVGLIIMALLSALMLEPTNVVLTVTGAVVGLVFIGVSKVTGEKIGYGDSLLILALGIFLGFWKVMIVALIAFFASALFAIIMVSCKKKNRKASFPFVPFIALSYAIVVLVL
jgi:leader peptidase (prepilin peptidase)/N-methyltransferase